MRRRVLAPLLTALALAAPVGLAQPAAAATDCTTPLIGQTVVGNLNVPANAVCDLTFVTVTGNVTVQGGAAFTVTLSTVNGSLTATSAAVFLIGTTVVGSVNTTGSEVRLAFADVGGQVVMTRPTFRSQEDDSVVICGGSEFGGSVTIRNGQANTTGDIKIGSPNCSPDDPSSIRGNLSLLSNGASTITVSNAQIGGNLICSGNAVSPVLTNNTVKGKVVDQCVPIIIP